MLHVSFNVVPYLRVSPVVFRVPPVLFSGACKQLVGGVVLLVHEAVLESPLAWRLRGRRRCGAAHGRGVNRRSSARRRSGDSFNTCTLISFCWRNTPISNILTVLSSCIEFRYPCFGRSRVATALAPVHIESRCARKARE